MGSPCGPLDDPGASLERPWSDPGREMLIKPMFFNDFQFHTFHFWAVLGGCGEVAGATVGRLWSVLGAHWSVLGRKRRLRRAPRSSDESVSAGGAAAAREYEGDPQLHSVYAKYPGTPCPLRGGRTVSASRHPPTPFSDWGLRPKTNSQ